MLSADVEDVVAMKMRTTIKPAPTLPISTIAAAELTRLAETCAALSFTGRTAVPMRAATVSLSVELIAKWMEYQTTVMYELF